MEFASNALVVKVSVSDIPKSLAFYSSVLGFRLDDRYNIDMDGNWGSNSYVQLNFESEGKVLWAIGLFKDIAQPYAPVPQTGTVPSFMVTDIQATLAYLKSNQVVIDQVDGQEIISSTSDSGYTDLCVFFRDPDGNSWVVRQNVAQGF